MALVLSAWQLNTFFFYMQCFSNRTRAAAVIEWSAGSHNESMKVVEVCNFLAHGYIFIEVQRNQNHSEFLHGGSGGGNIASVAFLE